MKQQGPEDFSCSVTITVKEMVNQYRYFSSLFSSSRSICVSCFYFALTFQFQISRFYVERVIFLLTDNHSLLLWFLCDLVIIFTMEVEMVRQLLYPTYWNWYEYFDGSCVINCWRTVCRETVYRWQILFESASEAQLYFETNCGG